MRSRCQLPESPGCGKEDEVGLEGARSVHPPGAPVSALGSPGDQAVRWTATVEIPDPVVVDAEAAGAWCEDLTGRGI